MSSSMYQQLIDLLTEAEFPHIKIERLGRFLETVRCINSPLIKAVWTGKVSKQTYLKRLWVPRTRNTSSEQGTYNYS